MTPRPTNPLRPSAPRSATGLALVAAALLAAPLVATPARAPLLTRLEASLFPAQSPGYLPLVGTPGLRFAEPSVAAAGIKPPPVALYAPRVPAPPLSAQEAKPMEPAPTPATQPPATANNQPSPPVRPEDVLPYFQLGDGSGRGLAEGLQFTPAQPSRAEYRQQ